MFFLLFFTSQLACSLKLGVPVVFLFNTENGKGHLKKNTLYKEFGFILPALLKKDCRNFGFLKLSIVFLFYACFSQTLCGE